MIRALEELTRLAGHRDVPILIEGETGTGKTMIARHLHAISPRASGPFQHVLVAALEDALASSDLFGHVTGAFTGAHAPRLGGFLSAQHGTLFLDEIGKASFAVQRKLLHAIEHCEITPVGSDRAVRVDARVIAASNVPLADAVKAENFLNDLYERLKVCRVRLPALRERRADIPLLVERCVAVHTTATGAECRPPAISDALMRALCDADWPGNMRELNATIGRLLIDAGSAPELTVAHCRDSLGWPDDRNAERGPLTRARAMQALADADKNVSRAARNLGASRTTMYRALERQDPD